MSGQAQAFRVSPELDAQTARAAQRILAARSVTALTGAGISVESGIPPFRGPGGLWTRYGEPPLDGYQRFVRDPAAFWRERLHPTEPWAKGLASTLKAAKPGKGHLALAELEALGCLDALITQNVDDLHRQAGQQKLLEIHGNHSLLRCSRCHARFEPREIEVDEAQLPPHCPNCNGIVKGDTVSFGEPIPPDVLHAVGEAVRGSDLMLVVGTSATVFPAADFPLQVLQRGGALIEVNPEASELSHYATESLRGPAGALLERLLHHVARSAQKGKA